LAALSLFYRSDKFAYYKNTLNPKILMIAKSLLLPLIWAVAVWADQFVIVNHNDNNPLYQAKKALALNLITGYISYNSIYHLVKPEQIHY
jgi:hypothetical protein